MERTNLQLSRGEGAKEGLDHCGAFEGVPVSGQLALRVSDLPLHGYVLALLYKVDLPGSV